MIQESHKSLHVIWSMSRIGFSCPLILCIRSPCDGTRPRRDAAGGRMGNAVARCRWGARNVLEQGGSGNRTQVRTVDSPHDRRLRHHRVQAGRHARALTIETAGVTFPRLRCPGDASRSHEEQSCASGVVSGRYAPPASRSGVASHSFRGSARGKQNRGTGAGQHRSYCSSAGDGSSSTKAQRASSMGRSKSESAP